MVILPPPNGAPPPTEPPAPTPPTDQLRHVPEMRADRDVPLPLGYVAVHDRRSLNFAVPAAAVELRDVKWPRRIPPYDQGARLTYRGRTYADGLGCCTATAGCGVLSTGPHRHRYRSMRTVLGYYDRETELDPFAGDFPPDDTGSSCLAFAQTARERRVISRYEHALSLEGILAGLQRGPILSGTWWTWDGFTPDADGRVRFTGGKAGGHAYETFGCDLERRRLWHWQSWWVNGKPWGLGGTFYTTFDDHRAQLADDGDAILMLP